MIWTEALAVEIPYDNFIYLLDVSINLVFTGMHT